MRPPNYQQDAELSNGCLLTICVVVVIAVFIIGLLFSTGVLPQGDVPTESNGDLNPQPTEHCSL